MELRDKVTVVTGGASGIGKAICRAFANEGATVVAVDISSDSVAETAREVNGVAMTADVTNESDVESVVNKTLEQFGRIDLFFSNAGISRGAQPGSMGADILGPNEAWEASWAVNTMSHVYAARAVLPHMLARGEGYICSTASAAGLLTSLGGPAYAVTKHGAVAFAEFLAMTYGDDGIKVSCLCPQGERTPMLVNDAKPEKESPLGNFLLEGAIAPELVADVVVRALREETFLILPHPEVREYLRRKGDDPDRWLRGMRRLWKDMKEKLHPS